MRVCRHAATGEIRGQRPAWCPECAALVSGAVCVCGGAPCALYPRQGLRLRWCECGAIGIFVDVTPRKPLCIGWVRPGVQARQALAATLLKARRQAALVAALPTHRRLLDSPVPPLVPAESKRSTRGVPGATALDPDRVG